MCTGCERVNTCTLLVVVTFACVQDKYFAWVLRVNAQCDIGYCYVCVFVCVCIVSLQYCARKRFVCVWVSVAEAKESRSENVQFIHLGVVRTPRTRTTTVGLLAVISFTHIPATLRDASTYTFHIFYLMKKMRNYVVICSHTLSDERLGFYRTLSTQHCNCTHRFGYAHLLHQPFSIRTTSVRTILYILCIYTNLPLFRALPLFVIILLFAFVAAWM